LVTQRRKMNTELTYEILAEAVAGDGVGVRCRTTLEPLGGAGDKVFPPTYGTDDRAETKYALEKRVDHSSGEPVVTEAVVLDAVASQANRMELALLEAFRSGELKFPVVSIDFESHGLPEYSGLSSLEAPHRIFDAILRDSVLDGLMFRLSETGRSITEASFRNASPLFRFAPTALIFGAWDSTGPRGGRGSKFERAITSEIVGYGVQRGVKTASRLDPLGIEKNAGPLFEAADGSGWTMNESEAKRDGKKQAVLFGKGDPSHANHGNIPPTVDARSGGVTVEYAQQTLVLSFVALRKLNFPTASTDTRQFEPSERRAAEAAARTALSALAIAAAVLAYEAGYDLRSRCVLAPVSNQVFELVRRGNSESVGYSVSRDQAIKLVHTAAEKANALGMGWITEELRLQPAQRLVDLVKKSKELSAPQPDSEN
jgi:CRISPR-associated protein Csb1